MSGVQTITVAEADSGQRLDRWFKRHFPQVRHGELEKLLRTGQIRVDGGRVKANRRLETGEAVRVPPLPETAPEPAAKPARRVSAEEKDLIRELVLYEDPDVIALNKPFGLAVQGGKGIDRHVDGMLGALAKGGERPRLVHRLDRDTGGVLLLGRTRKAATHLTRAFQTHEIEKVYWALVVGVPKPREGTIDLPIAKKMVRLKDGAQERVVPADDEDAKKAITDFMTVEDAGAASFVALRPRTGRTHQLRVHCAAMGAPIVGDGKYGGPGARIDGVAGKLHLFCRSMSFRRADGRRVTVTAPLTGHMRKTWSFFGFPADADTPFPEDLG